MTKTPYERAAAFLAEVDPHHQQKLTASIAPWIINRVAELLPPEFADSALVIEPKPEWGEPIPTPGDSCPKWFTDELADGCQFLDTDRTWGTSRAPLALRTKGWVWQRIAALRFPVGHPIYAQRQLEAAGYTVTPPAPPEPDYEAYREKLSDFYGSAGRGWEVGSEFDTTDKRHIEALIAVGVKP